MSRGLLFGAETATRNWRSEWDAVSGSALRRKLRPGIDAQNGMRFPVEPLAESVSRNSAPERDTLSGWSFKRKVHPGIRAWNGTHFPVVVHLETASQFERSFWDTLSVRPTIRKVHPVLSVQTGTRFPPAWLLGKHVPDWQDATRRVAVQRPLQLHVVKPCRQSGLPDACRLQLFREHACRTDFVHGKAQQGMTVKR